MVRTSNLVAKGTINLTDGEISPADGATNTMLWVGYQDNDTTPKIMANFNVSGGVINGREPTNASWTSFTRNNDVKWYRSC